ncbi:hypothetical protein QVD17_34850 [Tagetes erecta]|uniref:Uncharacterized protein n=1 Tax=Tagetes erecta TaxID=13708 RepID=A0AAD8JYA4_TARER|nr:hypothetical protein QVD17_34850 [Tagetes erecta]
MKTGGIAVCSIFVALVYIPEYSYGGLWPAQHAVNLLSADTPSRIPSPNPQKNRIKNRIIEFRSLPKGRGEQIKIIRI